MTKPTITHDYLERVYAGALGKVVGVYLGRPFEGWLYERIQQELGDIEYYVHQKLGVPLIVTDDDITGTFTFLQALPDHGNSVDITSAQIGESWLNYIIEQRTILWWGGLGNSTEHTAFLRLKRGIEAPRSGSAELNGKVVAEQIGAQIFIDGWAMIAPGQPELAADLAARAARVSHDGEAVYAAQALAAMEAQAFVESDIDALLDTGYSFVPAESVIARIARDLRRWHRDEPDWRTARALLEKEYGYQIYGGNVHVVPNHGLIVLALLYGEGDLDKSLSIVNTCGWDTDCNSGNLGCLLGIRNGLGAFEGARDWRGPVADRIYLPSADGGRAITDVATEAIQIANIGRHIAGLEALRPKGGARFHFELPGSVQSFEVVRGKGCIENVAGHSLSGSRSLGVSYGPLAEPVVATTPTFIPPEAMHTPGYGLVASPTLHSGQGISAVVMAARDNSGDVECRLIIKHYSGTDELVTVAGPDRVLPPGGHAELSWEVPDTGGQPISAVGLSLAGSPESSGTVYLDLLTWAGEPDVTLTRPANGGTVWRRAWVDALDDFSEGWGEGWPEPYRLIQNEGRGLLMQGSRQWKDYQVETTATPHLAEATGIAARVQGLRRYYALLISRDGYARLVRRHEGEHVLASAPIDWVLGRDYRLTLAVAGNRLRASVDDETLFDLEDLERPLLDGGVALVCDEGRVAFDAVQVRGLSRM